MTRVPLIVRCVYEEGTPTKGTTSFGPPSAFLPFVIYGVARTPPYRTDERFRLVSSMIVGSCVSGWRSPIFRDVPFGVIPLAPAEAPLGQPILVQGSDPCDFWLEADGEDATRMARAAVEDDRNWIVLNVVPLREVLPKMEKR